MINTLVGLWQFGSNFRKNIFAKKLCRFLFELKETTQDQRSSIIERVESSAKYQTKVGEFTLELLDKIDSNGKPQILGRLFCAVLEEKLDYSEYLRFAFIVQNSFYYDLVTLGKCVRQDGLIFESERYDVNWDGLIVHGLVSVDLASTYIARRDGDGNYPESHLSLTNLGRSLLTLGMFYERGVE